MEIISQKDYVKTRKIHSCHGCCRRIEIGEIVSVFTGKDDEVYHIYTCGDCNEFINLDENKEAVRETYQNEGATEGWVLEFEKYQEWKSQKNL